jgi:hypothetical protein
MSMPAELRARIAADYQPVRALPSPWTRAALVLPFALVALFAAPLVFNVRPDATRLGWTGLWGFSVVQSLLGFAVIAAALRESVPGRGWSRAALALWLSVPIAVIVAVTLICWQESPVLLRGGWWIVALACFGGSAATALPVVAFASILAARAYPTRPALAGALVGLGAGLMADAGWRIFCHFTEPSHVLSAHLAAVLFAAAIGSVLAVTLNQKHALREPE